MFSFRKWIVAASVLIGASGAAAQTSFDIETAGTCTVNAQYDGVYGAAVVFVENDFDGYAAGGSWWDSFNISYYQGVTEEMLGLCDLSDVTNLAQAGADAASFVEEDEMFLRFRATESDGSTYDYSASILNGVSTVTKTLVLPNTAPTADAGKDQSVTSGTQVTLMGSGTDSDGTIASYAWTRTGGTGSAANATLSSATAQNPTFTDSSLTSNDSAVTHVFSLVVTDDDGTKSTADTVTITITPPIDTTAPTVSLTGAPTDFTGTTPFTVGIRFSEDVTGFVAGDLTVTNGSVTSLKGSGSSYDATITPTGAGDVTVTVPVGVASDAAGNANSNAASATVGNQNVPLTQQVITETMQDQVMALMGNQPDLVDLLRSPGSGGLFAVVATQGQFDFDLANRRNSPIWFQITARRAKGSTEESTSGFAVAGSHIQVNPNLLVGGMVQLDFGERENGAANVKSQGWMVGPYAVARHPSQPLYFDASALYGEAENDISPLGTYMDTFTSTRWLLQANVTGEIQRDGYTLLPTLGVSHVNSEQPSYVDSLGATIAAQGIEMTDVSLGLDFERPLDAAARGNMTLTGGVSGHWAAVKGTGAATSFVSDVDGWRARIDLGLHYAPDPMTQMSLTGHYDGIGKKNYEAYGLNLEFMRQF